MKAALDLAIFILLLVNLVIGGFVIGLKRGILLPKPDPLLYHMPVTMPDMKSDIWV